jgi:nicotianamine synthase
MNSSISDSIRQVLRLEGLSPTPIVNQAFDRLVSSIIKSPDYDIALISPSDVRRVKTIAAEAESKLEDFWARQITNSDDPMSMLSDFPYASNYSELVQRELSLIEDSGLQLNEFHSVLIIGSGPLPLTAIEIKRRSGATVDCVDSSREAIQLCEQVGRALRIESTYFLSSGQNVRPNRQYNLILVAALAGSNLEQKQDIVTNMIPFLADGGRIVLRSAHGARKLLYPAFKASELLGVTLLKEYHPSDYIINSAFVYKAHLGN